MSLPTYIDVMSQFSFCDTQALSSSLFSYEQFKSGCFATFEIWQDYKTVQLFLYDQYEGQPIFF